MQSKKGLWLVLATAIISGVSIFLNKFGVSGVNPYMFTFAKNSLVAILLISSLFLFKDVEKLKALTRKQWLKLVLIGLFGGSIPFLLFFKGLTLTSAASGAFIHKTMFVWVAVLAVLFLRKKLDKKMFLTAGLLLAGNFLLLKINSFSFGTGELMIFGATLLWSAETILSKSVLKNLDAKIVGSARMFFGSIFILVFLLATGNFTFNLSGAQFGWIGVTSLLLFGYVFTWYSGLKLVSPTIATSILLLGSPITTMLHFLFSARAILPVQLIGMVLISAGAYTAIKFSRITTTQQQNPSEL